MEDTYWIDGIYNGGKFASGYSITLYNWTYACWWVGNVVLTFQNNPFINKFLPGEYINLTFNDEDYELHYYNGVLGFKSR
jgi:hypothetical protein